MEISTSTTFEEPVEESIVVTGNAYVKIRGWVKGDVTAKDNAEVRVIGDVRGSVYAEDSSFVRVDDAIAGYKRRDEDARIDEMRREERHGTPSHDLSH